MKWQFTDTGFNKGSFNMEFDLLLAKSLKPDEVILRFYRWQPYCISLGANQSENSLKTDKIFSEGYDVVRRPTGGRAILHAEELTYSVVFPAQDISSLKELYREINLAIKKGLCFFDDKLKYVSLEHNEPHFPSFYKNDRSAICFAVSSKNEINYEGKKLVGSAQRKMGEVILQHGSILCGDYHKKITDYLSLPEESLDEIRNEMNETTTDLQEILNKPVNIDELSCSIKKGFEDHFDAVLTYFNSEPGFVLSNG
jgi:lipoate-protein ligase A